MPQAATIASKYTDDGLSPQISAEELLEYIPAADEFCTIDTIQPFSLDSTNVCASHWLELAKLIEKKYEFYDGFVICHGTDTMAYTAAALSYLIQNNRRPIVITGAQKPIDLAITDAVPISWTASVLPLMTERMASASCSAAKSSQVPEPRKNFPKATMLFPVLIIRILPPFMTAGSSFTLMTKTRIHDRSSFIMR